MQLAALDWVVIVAYFAVSLWIGLAFRKRAGKGLVEYFASGRSFPWWIAGTGMVATTFAADTPLAVVGLTAEHGLAGNWFWWAMALGGMVTVFVYSRLWRRAEVLTDQEIVELRYGGKPAAFLRGFRAVYFALPINCIIVGWVTGAMVMVLKETVLYDPAAAAQGAGGVENWVIILICLAVVGLYSVLSGMWGVTITDVVQFVIAMTGCIVLAVIAVGDAGGIDALRSGVIERMGSGDALRFLPNFKSADPVMAFELFLVYLFVLWWASWYPGAEPGGGGYVVQRMASCRDEKHSLLATLWFQVAHYCVRPWPWLLVAFAAIVKYPDLLTLENKGVGFPRIMRDLLPVGLAGLLLVAFFAAFMSTLATQINWGASYLVSDVYKRFVNPGASEPQLAVASRWASALVLVAGGAMAYVMTERGLSVDKAWKILAALGAGTGAVYMLRWFWWRINAWTEIAAMVSSIIYYSLFKFVFLRELPEEYRLALVAGLTVITWLTATFVTSPERPEVLDRFYTKVYPSRIGWGPVAARLPHVKAHGHLGLSLLCALLGAAIVYLTLPGVGFIIFGDWARGIGCLAGAGLCAGGIVFLLNRVGWETMVK